MPEYTPVTVETEREYNLVKNAFDVAIQRAREALDYAEGHPDEYTMSECDELRMHLWDLINFDEELDVHAGRAKRLWEVMNVITTDPEDEDADAQEIDYEEVAALTEEQARYVWTLVDTDYHAPAIVPGIQHVNRLMHFRTVEPWTDADKELRWV